MGASCGGSSAVMEVELRQPGWTWWLERRWRHRKPWWRTPWWLVICRRHRFKISGRLSNSWTQWLWRMGMNWATELQGLHQGSFLHQKIFCFKTAEIEELNYKVCIRDPFCIRGSCASKVLKLNNWFELTSSIVLVPFFFYYNYRKEIAPITSMVCFINNILADRHARISLAGRFPRPYRDGDARSAPRYTGGPHCSARTHTKVGAPQEITLNTQVRRLRTSGLRCTK